MGEARPLEERCSAIWRDGKVNALARIGIKGLRVHEIMTVGCKLVAA